MKDIFLEFLFFYFFHHHEIMNDNKKEEKDKLLKHIPKPCADNFNLIGED